MEFEVEGEGALHLTHVDEDGQEHHIGIIETGGGGGDGGGRDGAAIHMVLCKFNEDVEDDQIDGFIKGYADLVPRIEPMKSFHWGRDVSSQGLSQGYTHIFEVTCESMEGIDEFLNNPMYGEFASEFTAAMAKMVMIDYRAEKGRR